MDTGNKNYVNQIMHDPAYNCPVCGARRYVTDQGNHELTLHCSSQEARFWDFPRGSAEQMVSWHHWDRSRKEIFLTMEDILKYLVEHEADPPAMAEAGGPQQSTGR